MSTTAIVVLVIVLVVAAAIAAWAIFGRRRSQRLQQHFGREYDHLVLEYKDKRRAEEELLKREKRLDRLNIRPLTPNERQRFADGWKQCQARFVDDPRAAVAEADHMVDEVMTARGYPVADFDTRAGDISVDHPHVITHYRAAREIALRHSRGQASTEDLRQAFTHYRELFDDLLERHLTEREVRR